MIIGSKVTIVIRFPSLSLSFVTPPFGRRMAMLRRQKGLSQRELGELLGTTQKTVDYYERPTLNPTLDVIQKVAEALAVPPAQLIGDNNGLMKISPQDRTDEQVQKVFEVVASLPPAREDHRRGQRHCQAVRTEQAMKKSVSSIGSVFTWPRNIS